MREEETSNIDAIALKRKLSKQFSETCTNEKGLIDREKLKRDIKADKNRRLEYIRPDFRIWAT